MKEAEDIIKAVSAFKTDLSAHKSLIAQLVNDLREHHAVAWEEWRARKTNSFKRDPPIKKSISRYGEFAGEGLEDWYEHFDRFYARKRGNPGANKENPDGPPVELLYAIHYYCLHFWTAHISTEPCKGHREWPITPKFHRSNRDDEISDDIDAKPFSKRSQRRAYNAPAAFFLAVAQSIHPDYLAENCYTVVDYAVIARNRSTESAARRIDQRRALARSAAKKRI